MIEVKDLNFSYKNKEIFENLNLKIEQNKWTTIIGNTGVGKTTLLKIIVGLINVENYELPGNICYISENPQNRLISETVLEELKFVEEENEKINDLCELLDFDKYLNESIINLTLSEKQTLVFITILLEKPQVLVLDNAFVYLTKKTKEILLQTLNELNITIINTTTGIEELLYADNIAIIENKSILINDTKENIFKNDYLKSYPFIIDLSKKLCSYELINNIIYTQEELVEEIWK